MIQVQKFLGSFGFLSSLSTYVSITSCVLNRYIIGIYIYIYIYIVNSSGHIGQTHSWFTKFLWKFSLALSEMDIKLASLTICSINYNLTNISSTPPSELKKGSTMYSKFNTFVYLRKIVPFIENLRIKATTCFKHQINITVVLLFCESFFQC